MPEYEEIFDRTEVHLMIKAYYTLVVKANKDHSIPYLNSTY